MTTQTQLPYDWKHAQDAIQTWASGVGLQAIWARQNAPRPSNAFVSLKITQAPSASAPQEHLFAYDAPSDGFYVTIAGQAEFICNVQVFCVSDNPDSSMQAGGAYEQWADAAGYCGALIPQLWLPAVQDAFGALNMCAYDVSNVTVLDDIAFGEFDSRASFDVSLRIASNYILTPQQSAVVPIKSTQYTGTTGAPPRTDTVNGA